MFQMCFREFMRFTWVALILNFGCSVVSDDSNPTTGLPSDCKGLSQYLTASGSKAKVPSRRSGSDDRLQSCQSEAWSGPTCCSADIELELQKAATNTFHDVLQSVCSNLGSSMKDDSFYFRDQFLLAVDEAMNSTEMTLSSIFQLLGVHDIDIHHVVQSLFGDISSYILGNSTIDTNKSSARFFEDLFPVVFHSVLLNGSSNTKAADHVDCLLPYKSVITPSSAFTSAFNFSNTISDLAHSARLLVNSLADGSKLFDAVMQWVPTNHCRSLLTKLTGCSACYGYPIAKPCQAFCHDVMSTCFVGAGSIDDLWSQFIDRLVQINRSMLKTNFEDLAISTPRTIWFSILHFLNIIYEHYQQIVASCIDPSVNVPPSSRIAKLISQFAEEIPEVVERPAPVLVAQLTMLTRVLSVSQGFFQRLPNVVCSHDKFLAEIESDCWNGTAFGQFIQSSSRLVRIDDVSSTVKSCSNILKNALKLGVDPMAAQSETAVQSDDAEMLADRPYDDYSGSDGGDRHHMMSDDEDFGSGGSGDDISLHDRDGFGKHASNDDIDLSDDESTTRSRPPSPYHTTSRPPKSSAVSQLKGRYSIGFIVIIILNVVVYLVH